METNLKKLLPMVGVMLTSLTLVNADQYNNDMSQDTSGSRYQANPSTNPPSDDRWGGFVWGEYILWTPRAQLVAGISGMSAAGSANLTQGQALYPDMKLLSGFRVGLGMSLDHDQWDILVDYTWLRQNSTSQDIVYTSGSGTTAYASYVLNPASSANLVQVSQIGTYWTYQFNNIDLDCGRDFFVGHYFAMRPHAGFKFAWTNNTFFNQYSQTSGSDTWNVTQDQDFWGVGPRVGLDPTFFFNDNWQIFVTSAMSLPWSKFSLTNSSVNVTDTLTMYNYTNDFYTIAPVLEAAIGLRWVVKFGDSDEYSFGLQTGWEVQEWFNQNNWVGPTNAVVSGGAISQQGLTVRARFDF